MRETSLQRPGRAVHRHRHGVRRHFHEESHFIGTEYSSATADYNVYTAVVLLDLSLVSHISNESYMLSYST